MKTSQTEDWRKIIFKYNQPDPKKSWWQLANSVIPYVFLWIAMYYSLSVSYWITLLLSVIAAGFLVRIFIIFHDCGHGSFFKSEKMNRIVGIFTGLLVFTPYHKWHRDHKKHHATVGNLDKRGIGDVTTLTVDEYKALSGWGKFKYRFYRHPLFLFGLGPMLLFTVQNRFTKKYMSKKEKLYVHLTSLGSVAWVSALIWIMGANAFLLIILPILYIATIHGVWLFYVQHQYEHVLWTRSNEWDYKTIALEGSSYFKLPRILQWFTGNIGFHHIHHLSSRIPNYNLEKCHNENGMFRDIKPVTFFSSLKSLKLRLWDEKNQQLISFRDYKNLQFT